MSILPVIAAIAAALLCAAASGLVDVVLGKEAI